MADNPTVAGISWAANDIASVFYQRSKISLGAPGSASDWLLGQQNMANSAPVVIASNQSAVAVSGPLTDTQLRAAAVPVSGPLTDAQLRASAVSVLATGLPVAAATTAAWTSATAGNTALSLAVTGLSTVLLTLNPTSTFTGGVLTFEYSDDGGTTWFPIAGVRMDSGLIETTYTIVASTLRGWQFDTAGATNFRVRLSTVIAGTGTANLRLQATAANSEPAVSVASAVGSPVAVRLTDGAAFYSAAGVKGATLTATAVSVGTTATLLLAADATRIGAVLTPMGAVSVFLGPSGVSTSNGQEFSNAKPFEDYLSTAALYGIVASGTVDVRVLKVTP